MRPVSRAGCVPPRTCVPQRSSSISGLAAAFTWVSDFIADAEAHTRVTVTLEPAGPGQTRLHLEHDELPDSDTYAGHEAGWARILDLVSQNPKKES